MDKLGLFQLNSIIVGDCCNDLHHIPDESITAVFSDPPYGLTFMGKKWDKFKSNAEYQAWVGEWATELLRVCKPGAVGLFFGGTRTFHRLACGLEDAGWEVYDMLMWVMGQGFPKSHNISKAIDKAAGVERNKMGIAPTSRPDTDVDNQVLNWGGHGHGRKQFITKPATDLAKTWDGYGTALKPAWEPIILARKPRGGKTYAQCAVEHGAGAMNIDEARVVYPSGMPESGWSKTGADGSHGFLGTDTFRTRKMGAEEIQGRVAKGRWPANVILDEEAARLLNEESGPHPSMSESYGSKGGQTAMWGHSKHSPSYLPLGTSHAGPSRFFYCAKASRAERDAGLEGTEPRRIKGRDMGQDERNVPYKNRPAPQRNQHPTVKPLALTEYLARLIRPPEKYLDDAVLLVPFCGTGSEIIGAIKAGWRNWLGIEMDEEYTRIAKARIVYWQKEISVQSFQLELPNLEE